MASEHRRWDARAVDDVGIHAGCMAADYHARQAAADLVRRLPDGPARLPRAGWTLSLRMDSVIGRSLSGGGCVHCSQTSPRHSSDVAAGRVAC